MPVSEKTKKLLRKVFTGDLMVYSFFLYLYSAVQGMKIIFAFPNWDDPQMWLSFVKDILIGDAFILLSGLLGNVIGNMKKDKAVQEHERILQRERERDRSVRRQARSITEAYLRLQSAAIKSNDDAVRMAVRDESTNMINAGVSLWDFMDKLENVEDEIITDETREEIEKINLEKPEDI